MLVKSSSRKVDQEPDQTEPSEPEDLESEASIHDFLFLGSLELLLNQIYDNSELFRKEVSQVYGTTIEVRTSAPETTFYILICENGIELSNTLAGKVDLSITAPMGVLVYQLMCPDSWGKLENSQISIIGKPVLVTKLKTFMKHSNFLEAVQFWIKDVIGVNEFISLFQSHDPAWALRLKDLPKEIAAISKELSEQSATQQEMLEEILALKECLRSERRTDIISITLGTSFLMGAIATAAGALPILSFQNLNSPGQTLILAATGLTLMLSRIFGKRYH